MKITLGSTVLCAGIERNQSGQPVGPANFRSSETPGVIKHDYVGANRTTPEHIRCDAGVIAFDVTRTFATLDEAIEYALVGIKAEAVSGVLKFGEHTVFATAAVTSRTVAQTGCSVSVSYTIEG